MRALPLASIKKRTPSGDAQVPGSYRAWLQQARLQGTLLEGQREFILLLIEQIDHFARTCNAGEVTKALQILFPVLLSHLQGRFASEERLMCMLSDHDDFEWIHLAQHRELLAHLEQMYRPYSLLARTATDLQVASASPVAPVDVASMARKISDYLSQQVMFHFATSDRELAQRLLQCHTQVEEH